MPLFQKVLRYIAVSFNTNGSEQGEMNEALLLHKRSTALRNAAARTTSPGTGSGPTSPRITYNEALPELPPDFDAMSLDTASTADTNVKEAAPAFFDA